MFNLLGAEEINPTSIILMVVLVVLLVAYIFFGMRSRKKNQEKAMQMLNELKTGDKIVTNAGIYGEVVSIRETNMGKVVTIKTGDDETKKISYMTINASVILGIDEKKDLILDKDGNVIDDEEKTEELKKEILKESSSKKDSSNEETSNDESKKEIEKKEEASSSEIQEEENDIIKKVKSKSSKKK